MNQEHLKSVAKIGIEAALAAGKKIKVMRESGTLTVQDKADKSLLTSADLAAQEIIVSIIAAAFPDHTIVSEELPTSTLVQQLSADQAWVIDPIDGTTNYAYGLHDCAVSIGFAEKGVGKFGVVYNPFTEELFTAQRGSGAFCNEKRIFARKNSNLRESIIASGFPPYLKRGEFEIELASKVLRSVSDIRRAGACSLDLCSVACGRLDGHYESVKPWDMAAGAVILRESGAHVGNFLPNKDGFPEELNGHGFYCCTQGLKADFLKLLQS